MAYTSCESQYKDSVQLTLRQIDVIRRLIQRYPNKLQLVTAAADIETSWRSGKIASMIAVEGGHSVDSSLGVLRLYYNLGVRYLTLTHTCNTPWYVSLDRAPSAMKFFFNHNAKRNSCNSIFKTWITRCEDIKLLLLMNFTNIYLSWWRLIISILWDINLQHHTMILLFKNRTLPTSNISLF